MNHTIAKRTLLLVGLLIAASLAWIAGNGLSKPATASAGPVQDAAAIAQARQEVSVLARAANADDALPTEVVDSALMADDPVDPGSARLVRGAGRTTWLASSTDGSAICEIAAGAMACPPVVEIVTRGLSPVIFSRQGEPVHISGVAIDSVETVGVIFGGGHTISVPVVDNLFTLDVDAWPDGLRWRGPNGPESFSFPPLAH